MLGEHQLDVYCTSHTHFYGLNHIQFFSYLRVTLSCLLLWLFNGACQCPDVRRACVRLGFAKVTRQSMDRGERLGLLAHRGLKAGERRPSRDVVVGAVAFSFSSSGVVGIVVRLIVVARVHSGRRPPFFSGCGAEAPPTPQQPPPSFLFPFSSLCPLNSGGGGRMGKIP